MRKYFLYYAGFNKQTGEEQVGVAKSLDLNKWEYLGDKPQVPLKSQGLHDFRQTSNPCVLKHNGLYKMWYQGKSDSGFLSICYSESKDGLSWKAYDKAVLAPNLSGEPEFREGFQHPHVVFDENKNIFKMWCVVYKKGLTSIGFCESVNGLIWSEIKMTNIVSTDESLKYFYPFILKENNSYKMWFTERKDSIWQVSFASSLDGLNWEFYKNNPTISPSSIKPVALFFEAVAKLIGISFEVPIYGIGSPFVWKEGDKYMLIGHEVGPRGKLYIPLYLSEDGLSWKKIKNNILPKPDSTWNNFFQADPYLYVEQ